MIYARIDGGYSIWDPVRNYGKGSREERVFQFTSSEVWEGKATDDDFFKQFVCNGLIRDLETWRLKNGWPFKQLAEMLATLSPSPGETLQIGEPVRISPGDSRDISTLSLPYGNVPTTLAASGIKRILSMAYLLVWAWHEHLEISKQKREKPGNRIVVLIDEIEAHLHPRWQRTILTALFASIEKMIGKGLKSIQLITTTHSPLIPSSVETFWDPTKDSLFDFDLSDEGVVEFRERPFARHGSVEQLAHFRFV